MSPFNRRSDEDKAADAAAKRHVQERRADDEAARQQLEEAHIASLPKWEYQVKRVGEDKQKGLLGSQRMEQIFNGEGDKGWELVAISEERATFKRRRPD
jgi:hypothetical protein